MESTYGEGGRTGWELTVCLLSLLQKTFLKVDSNEKLGGSQGRLLLSFSLGLRRDRGLFSIWTCSFPFPIVTAKLIGDVLTFLTISPLRSAFPIQAVNIHKANGIGHRVDRVLSFLSIRGEFTSAQERCMS